MKTQKELVLSLEFLAQQKQIFQNMDRQYETTPLIVCKKSE